MFIRVGSTAFLFNQGKILLIKRSQDKKIAPGVWSGIGGHSEPHELNNPLATCYREVYEESGINKKNINSLILRYIILRKCCRNNEIRISYIYFGKTDIINVRDTSEGKLFWVDKAEAINLKMSFTYHKVIEHYFNKGYLNSDVFVGVTNDDGIVNWSILGDYNLNINKK